MPKPAIVLVLAVLLWAPLVRRVAAQGVDDNSPRYSLSSARAQKIIERRARAVMLAIKARDMQRLATFVHPGRGVRFSPYISVDTKTERALSRQQVVNLYWSRRRLVWGEADGSGDPIRLTFRQYLKRYVYRQDLLSDREVGYNPLNRRGPGTAINNLLEVYPRAILVRYSHEGITGPQGGAMDWQQLWLVFEKWRGEWYLVGIANNEWTI
jgi:hypothetical protein